MHILKKIFFFKLSIAFDKEIIREGLLLSRILQRLKFSRLFAAFRNRSKDMGFSK